MACIPLEESGSLQAPAFRHGVHDISSPNYGDGGKNVTVPGLTFHGNKYAIAGRAVVDMPSLQIESLPQKNF